MERPLAKSGREGFRTCWSFNTNGVCVFIRVTFLCTSVKYRNVHFLTILLTLSQSSFFSIPKLLTNIMKIEIGVFVRFSHRVSTKLVFSFCFLVSILFILILSFLWWDMSATGFTIIINKYEELTPTRPCFKSWHSLYYFNLPISLMRYVILLMVYSIINITPILWVINWHQKTWGHTAGVWESRMRRLQNCVLCTPLLFGDGWYDSEKYSLFKGAKKKK